ncbi:TetR/AcrR family transcriptional regulator [Mycolicibacterium frederiksbergense]|uniref:TetR/AcrR family transcriptional regulator n=1 Tax=Mycolicibacterium frederiksbergense TaxID=117567 RepID=UPI00399B47E7
MVVDVGSDQDARNRMVTGAADMLGRRGLSAMTVRELARHAGAPLGSTYHYFPGGKAQLAAEAVRWADAHTTAELRSAAGAGPAAMLDALLRSWRESLVESDFQRGCAVLAVAVANSTDDDDAAPRDAAVFAFSNWTTLLVASLREAGVPHPEATDTATLIVAAVEGAVAMSRAERSTDPLAAVGRRLHAMLAALRP